MKTRVRFTKSYNNEFKEGEEGYIVAFAPPIQGQVVAVVVKDDGCFVDCSLKSLRAVDMSDELAQQGRVKNE